jgi:hypothetical protein
LLRAELNEVSPVFIWLQFVIPLVLTSHCHCFIIENVSYPRYYSLSVFLAFGTRSNYISSESEYSAEFSEAGTYFKMWLGLKIKLKTGLPQLRGLNSIHAIICLFGMMITGMDCVIKIPKLHYG